MAGKWTFGPMTTLVERIVGLTSLALAAACGSSSGSSPTQGEGGVGHTPSDSNSMCKATVTQGPLAGKLAGATCEYLGIPYGAPPTGALRFMPPQPAAGWSAPRDATAYGPSCLQASNGLGGVGATSEDCLSVNVFTPQQAPAHALPVMVFIYGGAFTSGSSSLYDGQPLSEKGPVVLVSMNYRLGAMGFLAVPQLDAERAGKPSGSDGIRDQQLALQWVHDNIATFHGDPANVTVFGESAGGTSTCIHIVSPGSQALANRFVVESGLCMGHMPEYTTQASAYQVGQALAGSICGGDAGASDAGAGGASTSDVLGCLRAADGMKLVTWVPAAGSIPGNAGLLTSLLGPPFSPVVEGPGGVLPDTPANLIASGKFNKNAAVVAGSNKNEWGLFVDLATNAATGGSSASPLNIKTAAQFDQAMMTVFGSKAMAVEQVYPVTDATASQTFIDVFTDYLFRCPARDLAQAFLMNGTKDVFLYSYEIGPAWHSFELVPLFNLVALTGLGAVNPSQGVTQDMLGYWTQFAASGDPNAASNSTEPAWPSYATASDQYLEILDPTPMTITNLRKAECDYWAMP
jgi:para-nitrobenzyl esterase